MGLTPDEADKLAGLALDVAEATRELTEAQAAWKSMKDQLPLLVKGSDTVVVDELYNGLTRLVNKRTQAWETFGEYLKAVTK